MGDGLPGQVSHSRVVVEPPYMGPAVCPPGLAAAGLVRVRRCWIAQGFGVGRLALFQVSDPCSRRNWRRVVAAFLSRLPLPMHHS